MNLPKLLFIGFAFIGCNGRHDQNFPSDKKLTSNVLLDSNFNLLLIPDSNVQWPPIIGLVDGRNIQNVAVTVSQWGNLTVLVTTDSQSIWWPGNLPDFVSKEDNLIVSGKFFEIPRSEKMPGKPIILSSIYIRSKFKNAFESKR